MALVKQKKKIIKDRQKTGFHKQILTSAFGNTVSPPLSTSDKYIRTVAIR